MVAAIASRRWTSLAPLARKYVPIFIAIYLAAKVGDMIWRGTWRYLLDGSYEGWLWIAEMLLIVSAASMLFVPRVTQFAEDCSAVACLAIILGVVLNRLNVFVLGVPPAVRDEALHPVDRSSSPYRSDWSPALMLVYRVAVTYLPILEPRPIARRRSMKLSHSNLGPQRGHGRWLVVVVAILLLLLLMLAFPHIRQGRTRNRRIERLRSGAPSTVPTTRPENLGPDVVILKELVNEYEPVPFDHRGHAAMSQMWNGCTTCHHRPPTTRPTSNLATQAATKPEQRSAGEREHDPGVQVVPRRENRNGDIRMPTPQGSVSPAMSELPQGMDARQRVLDLPQAAGGKDDARHRTGAVEGRRDQTMHPPMKAPTEKTYIARFTPAVGNRAIFRHDEHANAFGFALFELSSRRQFLELPRRQRRFKRRRAATRSGWAHVATIAQPLHELSPTRHVQSLPL